MASITMAENFVALGESFNPGVLGKLHQVVFIKGIYGN